MIEYMTQYSQSPIRSNNSQSNCSSINEQPRYYTRRNDDDDLIRCEQCLDHEHEEDDSIVMCDACNCSVHLKCYSQDDSLTKGIPKGDWYCLRCQ